MSIKERLKLLLSNLPPRVKIGRRYVGPGEPVFVIAEVGINHNGDIELAKKLILAAKEAGADAVKFQKRTTEDILTREGLDKPYTSVHAFAPTYGEHRNKLEFSREQYEELKKFSQNNNILFFASVWDEKSADAVGELDIDAYKIPSADLINIPLLEHVAKKNRPILLSTGMNTMEEVEEAVNTILNYNNRIVLFHCLSLYPAPEDKINMKFMHVMKERFYPLPFGYSGHEIDLLPTLVAVSQGAHIVERHLTLDKKMKGSDHAASLEPGQLKELINNIQRIQKILGVAEKIMYDELVPLREKLAKSVASKISIAKGTKITREMLTVKGPGHGIKPSHLYKLIGAIAREDIPADYIIPKKALDWDRN